MKIKPVITEYNISLTGYEVSKIQEEYTYLLKHGCNFTSEIKELLETIYKINLSQKIQINNLQKEG